MIDQRHTTDRTATMAIAELAACRTAPVTVRLNVAQLVFQTRRDTPVELRAAMLPDLRDALVPIRDSLTGWRAAHPVPASGTDSPAREAYELAEKKQARRVEAAEQTIVDQYGAAFAAYAHAFTVEVRAAAAKAGLPAQLDMQITTNPDSLDLDQGRNPGRDGDPLVWHLWNRAWQATVRAGWWAALQTLAIKPHAAQDGVDQ